MKERYRKYCKEATKSNCKFVRVDFVTFFLTKINKLWNDLVKRMIHTHLK